MWTGAFQRAIMVFGVGVIFSLMLYQTGRLEKVTRSVSNMTPPEDGEVSLRLETVVNRDVILRKGSWLEVFAAGIWESMVRTKRLTKIPAERQSVEDMSTLIVTTPGGNCLYSTRQFGNGRSNDDRQKEIRSGARSGLLSLGMAFRSFVFLAFAGAGQPSNMVCEMAFKGSQTLRRSIVKIAVYYSLIYFPLIIMFCYARIIVPERARALASPFAAVMSSVAIFY